MLSQGGDPTEDDLIREDGGKESALIRQYQDEAYD